MGEVLITREDGRRVGIACDYVVPQFRDGSLSRVYLGRAMFHLPSLGLSEDFDALVEETLVIDGMRLVPVTWRVSCVAGSVLILEGLQLVQDWRPAGGALPTPGHWMAL